METYEAKMCPRCCRERLRSEWKESAWNRKDGAWCHFCYREYERNKKDPEFKARKKALRDLVIQARKTEKAALRADIIAVRKQLRKEAMENRHPQYLSIRNSCRDLNLDFEEIWPKFLEHHNNCEICGAYSERLVIDHCHKTGRFRGFLCSTCNSGIGFLYDNPLYVASALKYLLEK